MMHQIYDQLYTWYRHYGRHDLPWRNTDDPYQIYLSEVMLQQTQVKTVLERYYFPFLQKFPTLTALAEASQDEVLKMWEGLGYYTRARNLHQTARLTAPQLPVTYEKLLQLPGIGKNTASAICAFAYRQKRAVMEANVRRVICRIDAIDDPKEAHLIQRAHELLDEENPFDYNQAMMDLGAMLCTPKEPACGECAFQTICRASALGCFDFPLKKQKNIPTRRQIIVVRHDGSGRVALEKREGRFLHGLWGFPESTQKSGQKIGQVHHQYSHFRLEVAVYLEKSEPAASQMYSAEEIADLALSTVDKKIMQLLQEQGITSRQ